jgi:Chaperone of endosialidase
MADASSGLLRLRPVTYRYKQAYADGSKPIDYGLIAEEVAEVYPDLVVMGADGLVQTVQYQKLTPMLLNELQKQNEIIRQQREQVQKLESRLAAIEAMLAGKAAMAQTEP